MPVDVTGAKVLKSTCGDCHCFCGIIAYVRDNKILKIEGDPDHPMNKGVLCPKPLSYKQMADIPNRLLYPMKRSGERGENKWQRVTWDQALDEIGSELKRIRATWGPESIATKETSKFRQNCRFACCTISYAISGSPNVGTIGYTCKRPGMIAHTSIIGQPMTFEYALDFMGGDPEDTKCLVVWGANPVHSHPILGYHIMKVKQTGAKLIVVDPRFQELAAKADLYLQVRPGADCALALGMLNYMIEENLYNKPFVDKWCIGFRELKERVRQYPLDLVEKLTWVPKEKIKEAVRMYCTSGPATIHTRLGLDQNVNGVDSSRAIAMLIALTGNIDIPGGNVFPERPRGFGVETYHDVYKDMIKRGGVDEKKRVSNYGEWHFPLFSGPVEDTGHLKYWQPCNTQDPIIIKAAVEGKPYPIKAILTPSNLVLNTPGSRRVVEALKKCELVVCWGDVMNATARWADFVLPCAHWAEREDGVVEMPYRNFISVRKKLVDPPGEAWDERKFVLELAKRMGVVLPWSSVEEMNETYNLVPYSSEAFDVASYAELRERGFLVTDIHYRKYETQGFKTPSGKIELTSSLMERFGYDPLPQYHDYPDSPLSDSPLAKDYPLVLITGNRRVHWIHSEKRNVPWLRELEPDPELEINPETAKSLGVKEGDWVWVESPWGKVRVTARYAGLHPRVVASTHEWYYPEMMDENLEEATLGVTINTVVPPDPPYDPIAACARQRGFPCKVYKAESAPYERSPYAPY